MKDHTDKNAGRPVRDGFERATLYDMEYMIPRVPYYSEYHFGHWQVTMDDVGSLDKDIWRSPLILPAETEGKKLHFTIHGITPPSYRPACHPAMFAIYRKGCPEPLVCQEHEGAGDCKLSLDSSHLTSGNYYLYFGNVYIRSFSYSIVRHGYMYPFSIYEHGIRRTLPEISKAIVRGNLVLTLYFVEPLPPDTWLSCECHDEKGRLVAAPDWLETDDCVPFANLGMKVGRTLPPGIYHLSVYLNSHLKERFSFLRWEEGEHHAHETKKEPLCP